VHCAPVHGLENMNLPVVWGWLDKVINYNVIARRVLRAICRSLAAKRSSSPNGKEGDANAARDHKLVEVGGLLAGGKIKHSYTHSTALQGTVSYRNTPQWVCCDRTAVGRRAGTFA